MEKNGRSSKPMAEILQRRSSNGRNAHTINKGVKRMKAELNNDEALEVIRGLLSAMEMSEEFSDGSSADMQRAYDFLRLEQITRAGTATGL